MDDPWSVFIIASFTWAALAIIIALMLIVFSKGRNRK